MKEIIWPYKPRWYQQQFREAIQSKKRAFILLHRRAGKDISCFNELAIRAATDIPATYFYILPTYAQGKKVIWKGITEDGRRIIDFIPKELKARVNNSEMIIELINGSIIQIIGSEQYDSLRGTNPKGVVFSEYAMQDPRCWTEIISPVLLKNGGWALFNTCVAPETLIMMEDGLREIQTVSNQRDEYNTLNKNVYGLGGFHNAEQFYYGGKQKLLKITTSKGYQLRCTKVHPIWDGEEWKKAGEWKVGEYMPIQRGQQVWSDKSIDISSWKKPVMGKQGRKNHLPENFLDIDFFYFLGLYLAEGNCHGTNKSRPKNMVTITNTDPEIHAFLLNRGFRTYDNLHFVYGSTELASFIEWFGLGGRANEKTIPSKLFQCKKEETVAFLQGYVDGDGSAGKKIQGHIVTCSSSEVLTRRLHTLLLNFGIIGRVRKRYTQPTKKVPKVCVSYVLEIEGHSAYQFYKQIGFRLTRKQSRSELMTEKVKDGYGDRVPINSDKLEDYTLPKAMVENPNLIGYRVLKKLNDKSNHPYLKKILEDNFYYDTIVSIEDDEDYVFDFVIPETHSFFSNGFISHNTPLGRNHAYDLWKMAEESDDWYTQKLTVEDTNLITPEQLLQELAEGKTQEVIQQEYYCSFEKGLDGSYYGRLIQTAREQGRIRHVPYDENLLVNTAWDLGIGDSTAIIFYQIVPGGEIHIIDYYENCGEALSHYMAVLTQKKYLYGQHNFPHDCRARELGTGATREETLRKLGITPTIVAKLSLDDGIQNVRSILPRCYFDKEKCKDLIKHIDNYRKHFSDKLRCFVDRPLHNEASHACDALRYASIAIVKNSGSSNMTADQAEQMWQQYA